MIPLALGTQTSGSTIRPASYCGITGFKVTYGLFSLDGVLPFARSLDTLGFFTHTPADMMLLWDALGRPTGREEDFALGAPEPMLEVEPEMMAAFHQSLNVLRKAGLSIRPVDLSTPLSKLVAAHHVVSYYEGARFHERRYKEYGDRLGRMAELVREGLQISKAAYDQAIRDISSSRAYMAKLYQTTPVILVPAATGPAPLGLSETGDAKMNRPWSALGTPAISVPMPVADTLPLGLQITANRGEDARVLQTAVRLHRILYQK